MLRLPPTSTLTATLFPYTTLFRSPPDRPGHLGPAGGAGGAGDRLHLEHPQRARCGGRALRQAWARLSREPWLPPLRRQGRVGEGCLSDQREPWAPPPNLPLPSQGEEQNKNSPAEACCRRAAPAGAWLSGPCKEKGAAAPLFACRAVVAASVLHPTPRCAAHFVGRHHLHGEAEGAVLARMHGADPDQLLRAPIPFR